MYSTVNNDLNAPTTLPIVGAALSLRASGAHEGPYAARDDYCSYKFTGVPMKSRLPSSTPQWRRMS